MAARPASPERYPSVLGGIRAGIRLGGRDLHVREVQSPGEPCSDGGAPLANTGVGIHDRTTALIEATAAPVEATAAPVEATAAPVEATAAPVEATAPPGEGVPSYDDCHSSIDVLSSYGYSVRGLGEAPHELDLGRSPTDEASGVSWGGAEPAPLSCLTSPGCPPSPQTTDDEDPTRQYRLDPSHAGAADLFVDCAGLMASVLAVAVGHAVGHGPAHNSATRAFFATAMYLAPCAPVLAAAISPTRRRTLQSQLVSEQLQSLALPLAGGGLAALAIWQVLATVVGLASPQLDWVLAMCAISLLSVPGARNVYRRVRRRASVGTRLVVVGEGAVADRLALQLHARPDLTVVGSVDDEPSEHTRHLGRLTDLKSVCRRESVGHVVVALSGSQPQTVVDAFRIDALRPVLGMLPITVVTPWSEELPTVAKIHGLGPGFAGVNFAPASNGFWARAVKVAIDRVVAALGIVCLAPLLVVVALAVRLSSAGPVLFRQERVGRNGRTFSILKFRTMRPVDSAEKVATVERETTAGPFPKLKDDPRVTRMGHVLRRTSVDELPQLWNVLRGEMSLVGPRPFMLDDAAGINGWALRRYSVRPGLTGLWQVSGRNELTFEDMCRLDQLYVNNWTLGLDITILIRTLRVVLTRQGAY